MMQQAIKIIEAEIDQRVLALKHNPINKDEIVSELDSLRISLQHLVLSEEPKLPQFFSCSVVDNGDQTITFG